MGESGAWRFPWGAVITHSLANYHAAEAYSYDTNPTRGYHATYLTGQFPLTSPAGAFAANAFGLYDMSGNVVEWCWDRYEINYYASSPSSDPTGPSSGTGRIVRGGGWGDDAYGCRVAARFRSSAEPGAYTIGFRMARGGSAVQSALASADSPNTMVDTRDAAGGGGFGITSASFTGPGAASLELKFTSQTGATYRVEKSPALASAASWTDAGVSVSGNGTVQTITISDIGRSGRCFFRIRKP